MGQTLNDISFIGNLVHNLDMEDRSL